MSETIPVHDAPAAPKRTQARRSFTKRTAGDAKGVGAAHAYAGADRAEPMRDDSPVETVTRKSRGERSVDVFHVPEHLKIRGCDYQWWPISILGQPVDGSQVAEAYEGGWRPVQAKHMAAMLAPGDTSATVDRRGQRLFQRPMHLTHQAKQEDYAAAEQMRRDRIEGALNGKGSGGQEGLSNIRGIKAHGLQLEVEAEAGSYSSSPLRK